MKRVVQSPRISEGEKQGIPTFTGTREYQDTGAGTGTVAGGGPSPSHLKGGEVTVIWGDEAPGEGSGKVQEQTENPLVNGGHYQLSKAGGEGESKQVLSIIRKGRADALFYPPRMVETPAREKNSLQPEERKHEVFYWNKEGGKVVFNESGYHFLKKTTEILRKMFQE